MDAMNHNMEILDQQTLPGQACWVSRKETPYRVRQALYPAAGRPAHRSVDGGWLNYQAAPVHEAKGSCLEASPDHSMLSKAYIETKKDCQQKN